MGTLKNSEDPDEMSHIETFHQGMKTLVRQNQFSEFFKIKTLDPSKNTMYHPNLTLKVPIATAVDDKYIHENQ